MKIWNNFGSEHSANIVLIGRFDDPQAAEAAKEAIDEIKKFVAVNQPNEYCDQYSEAEMGLLQSLNFFWVRPGELAQFRYEMHTDLRENEIHTTTEDTEIAVLIKLLISKGAKVEVYSAHNYPSRGNKP